MKLQPNISTQTWIYRHDEIMTGRPMAVDVDADGWLWQGCGPGRIVGHHLRTAEVRMVSLPVLGNQVVYQVFAWQGKLVLTLGTCPFYLVFDPESGACLKKEIPAAKPIVWYGGKTANDKVVLFERSESKALILESPDAKPRVAQFPFKGQLAFGNLCSDGLFYCSLEDPGRIVRFDSGTGQFLDENHAPFPEATISGRFEHRGVLYCADSARGRLLPLELSTGKWLEPIPTPDRGTVYGYIGGGFGFGGRGYFCLSTYAHPSRLDPKTGKIILPEGPLTVDGKPPRFLDRFLVFDPDQKTFDYLVAPPQPDGVPLLCYSWTDGQRFVITGIVTPYVEPGQPGPEYGPWLILQNQPAEEEPGFGLYDFNWDLGEHVRTYRRSYGRKRSLYLAELPWTLPISNTIGPATYYPPGKEAELIRRSDKTDPNRYWKHIVDVILKEVGPDGEKAKAITGFVHRSTYYNPIQIPQHSNPIALLESHDIRCGQAVMVLRALFDQAGIESRETSLFHHSVAEAFYDGGWHIADALVFGSCQPARDGRVLSVEELKADRYFADGFPQDGFVFDPESLLNEEGFQLLGYVFGPWGSCTYYSWYLDAEEDYPPTIPAILPAQREGDSRIRLRWAESIRRGGGPVEYEVKVCADRTFQQVIFRGMTTENFLSFDVPEQYRMYFLEVRAMDDHRRKNPDTWYPTARSNFVLAPVGSYGWYGVL